MAPAANVTLAASRPRDVLVADFVVAPGSVQVDSSPGVALQRSTAGISADQAATQDVVEVQNALSDTLVQKIQAMGLPARRVPTGSMPGSDELVVTGTISAINEGSRARRMVVGFGAGKSAVQGTAMLLRGEAAGPVVLQTYNLSANSGRMPGLAIGAAASGVASAGTALSAGAHAAGEAKRTPVGDQAASIGNHLSVSLGEYFAAQNWIPASAVPSSFP